MAVVLLINSVDKTANVDSDTIQINNILTNKRDNCSFDILTHTGDTYLPKLGSDIVITDNGTRVFGGVITQVVDTPQAYSMIRHKITCQDYTRLLDKKLIPNSFRDQTGDEIIQYLKDNYFPSGFTITNVDAPFTVNYISFNYKPLAKCIEELANMFNYDWYVDYNKDVHFFAKDTMVSPFDITDSGGKFQYDSLVIRKDNSQIRNTIIVRGGDYLASQTTFDILTNGTDAFYPTPYKLSDFGAHLTGEVLSVGIDNIDPADSYDALYNFQEKILKFKTGDKPTSGKTLKVSGKPNLPVIIKYRSSSDVQAMTSAEGTDGTYEYLILDKSINSKEGARQRARAEILAYAQTLSEGEFITETSGLKAGQKININSASRGINEDYIINQVTTSQFSKNTFIYNISLITTRTSDLIDILQKLLLESTRDIAVDENEVQDIVISLSDEIILDDSITATLTPSGNYKWGSAVWGNSSWNA